MSAQEYGVVFLDLGSVYRTHFIRPWRVMRPLRLRRWPTRRRRVPEGHLRNLRPPPERPTFVPRRRSMSRASLATRVYTYRLWVGRALPLYLLRGPPHWRARMYAAQRPFLLTSQVYFLQIGKLLRGPRKHFLPQSRSMIVRWCPRGSWRAQPFQGTLRRRRR